MEDDFDLSPTRPRWHVHAACRGLDPDLFFPERGENPGPAKAICATCPVQRPCLDAGMREKFGIWGGESERARRMIRRRSAA